MKKACADRRKISFLKYVKIRKRFKEKVIKLVDVGVQNLWGYFKDVILEPYDDVCAKKRGRRSKGDIWWWNEEVKVAVSKKKDAHKAVFQIKTEENNKRYKNMKNKANKVVS